MFSNQAPDSRNAGPNRLRLLAEYIQQDPDNIHLLRDAFSEALSQGDWAMAQQWLHRAQRRAPGDARWSLAESDLLIAQRRYDNARPLLDRLQLLADSGTPLAAVVTHNLAYVDCEQGDYLAATARLQPWVGNAHLDDVQRDAIQLLWVRALHRAGQLAQACDWAAAARQAGLLQPVAAGAAALAAIDINRVAEAREWSTLAAQAKPTPEHCVVMASLAMQSGDASAAMHWSSQALVQNPNGGRALSALAFAHLMARKLPRAIETFQRAVVAMPTHIGTWLGLGWTQLLLPDVAGAQQTFEAALALDRNFAQSHGSLAAALAMSGAIDAARREIEIARRLDPREPASRWAEAVLSGEAREPAKVQALARAVFAGLWR